jgi:hypothetical protein
MPISDALRRAYLDTSYRARAPQGVITIRIGETLPALDALLDAAGVRTWAFVTAWNPRSQRVPLAANEAAQRRLREHVAAAGWTSYVGAGVPARADWDPEPSLLVLGVSLDAARSLGEAFEQNAIVAGERGGPARLVDCTPARR